MVLPDFSIKRGIETVQVVTGSIPQGLVETGTMRLNVHLNRVIRFDKRNIYIRVAGPEIIIVYEYRVTQPVVLVHPMKKGHACCNTGILNRVNIKFVNRGDNPVIPLIGNGLSPPGRFYIWRSNSRTTRRPV